MTVYRAYSDSLFEMSRVAGTSMALVASTMLGAADTPPTASLTNGELHAKVYFPDAKKGFYRGTRFDWSGVIYSLQSAGHEYYYPWFTKTDPPIITSFTTAPISPLARERRYLPAN